MNLKSRTIARCAAAIATTAALTTVLPFKPAPASGFGLSDVAAKAKQLSENGYKKPDTVAEKIQKLSMQQWQSIRFRQEANPWPKGHFDVRFRPAGFLYNHPVKINVVNAQGVHRVGFSPEMFNYDKKKLNTELPKELGFAGFDLFYSNKREATADKAEKQRPPEDKNAQPQAHKKAGIKHEPVLTFLGASYFRARASDQVLGLSARGLAVDTATNAGEEFPYFREFWLARPSRDDQFMVIYALLDSPSITGAYRFTLSPGSPARLEVQAVLYPRTEIKKLGLAPLTSMYFYGAGRKRPPGQLLPAVHNSDGLLLETRDKRWIWRPLSDPDTLADDSFNIQSPRGFGLMQRNRQARDYPIAAKPYSRRPSAWVAPHGKWGKGHVELVQIPSPSEDNDNIAAFWVPREAPPAHKPLRLRYTLRWQGPEPPLPPIGRVVSTRINTTDSDDTTRRFALDFSGGLLKALHSGAGVDTVIEAADNGKITASHLERDNLTGIWRLVFGVKSKDGKPVQLRAYLAQEETPLTETWDYTMAGS